MENINTRFGGSDDANRENRNNEDKWQSSNVTDDRLNIAAAANHEHVGGLNAREENTDSDRREIRRDLDSDEISLTADDAEDELRDWGTVDPQNTREGTSMNDPSGPGSAV